MKDIIPFFYYDIVARIIPGGITLAVIAYGLSPVPFCLNSLVSQSGSWNGVLGSLVLGGFAYAIGVLFEGLFAFLKLNSPLEKKAWERAALECGLPREMVKDSRKPPMRTLLWERLVRKAAQDSSTKQFPTESGMKEMFSHCHRFQAEYKMCQHLVVPALLFSYLTFDRGSAYIYKITGILLLVIFPLVSYSRDKRRWWQLLVFATDLGWLDEFKQEGSSTRIHPN